VGALHRFQRQPSGGEPPPHRVIDRQESLSVSAWYQATLSQMAASKFYKYGVGMGLAHFFDW